MTVPLSDGSDEKFNWASGLSTIFQTKPFVGFDGGLFTGSGSVSHLSHSVQMAPGSLRGERMAFL